MHDNNNISYSSKNIGLTDSRRNRDMTSNDENKKQKKNKMK